MTRCSSSCWHLLSLSERSHPHHDGRRSPRQICVCTGHSHLGYRLWTFWSRVSETCCIRTNINLMSKVHFHWGSNDEQGSEHLVGTDAIDHQNKIRWWPRLLLEALDPGWRQGVPLRDAPRSLQGDRLRRRCSQRRKCREIERRGWKREDIGIFHAWPLFPVSPGGIYLRFCFYGWLLCAIANTKWPAKKTDVWSRIMSTTSFK